MIFEDKDVTSVKDAKILTSGETFFHPKKSQVIRKETNNKEEPDTSIEKMETKKQKTAPTKQK